MQIGRANAHMRKGKEYNIYKRIFCDRISLNNLRLSKANCFWSPRHRRKTTTSKKKEKKIKVSVNKNYSQKSNWLLIIFILYIYFIILCLFFVVAYKFTTVLWCSFNVNVISFRPEVVIKWRTAKRNLNIYFLSIPFLCSYIIWHGRNS